MMKKTLNNIIKKTLVPIVLTSMFGCSNAVRPNEQEMKENLLLNSAMSIQNSKLIYQDISETKFAMTKFEFKEINPIADIYWKNNLWELGYASALGANILGNYFSHQLDKTGDLSMLLNGVISLTEIGFIAWSNQNLYRDQKLKREINIGVNLLFYKRF